MSFDLLSSYYNLLGEYDKVLSLTEKLLYSLRSSKPEAFIKSLLDERSKAIDAIQKISRSLSVFEPSYSQKTDAKMISQLKSLHRKLEEKTSLLQKKEEELAKQVKDLD